MDHTSGEYRSTRTSHACWSPFLARVTRSATNGSSRIGVASFQVVPGDQALVPMHSKCRVPQVSPPLGQASFSTSLNAEGGSFAAPSTGWFYSTTLCSVRRSVCLAHYTVSVGVPTKDRRLAHQPHHNQSA